MNKFNEGDKVKIVKYGSLLMFNKNDKANDFLKQKTVYNENENWITIDMNPELVGQEGIVESFTLVQGKYEYTLKGPWKCAWYSENQLESI